MRRVSRKRICAGSDRTGDWFLGFRLLGELRFSAPRFLGILEAIVLVRWRGGGLSGGKRSWSGFADFHGWVDAGFLHRDS